MNKTFPTLYRVDTLGRSRLWYMIQKGNQYTTVAGLIDGEKVTSLWTTCKGKNIGRANETSPIEQATFEIEADYKKKLKGDYHESLKDAQRHEKKGATKGRFIKPMLAHKLQDCEDNIVFPCAVQPKLNGCLHGDTIVEFEDGSKEKIKDVIKTRTKKRVKTFNEKTNQIEYKHILDYFINGVDIKDPNPNWYRLELIPETEEEIYLLSVNPMVILTGNHRVWVQNKKIWRRVDQLENDDILFFNR